MSFLGRVLYDNITAYLEPNSQSSISAVFSFNDILPVDKVVFGEHSSSHNRLWYELNNGSFVQASKVQPVENQLNKPRSDISSAGELGTITVPYTQAWQSYRSNRKKYRLFFYGSNHWIIGSVKDEQGNVFYRIRGDRWENLYYIQAEHMHIFNNADLQPLSQQIPPNEKRIEVSLAEQLLIAYESEKPVFLSHISSGVLTQNEDLLTPPGEYRICQKRPSRHMIHTDKAGINDVDLYGVPWVSSFTDTGIAFHGTYWHNDFGKPHSHGCINLPINAARWIYLWCQPFVPLKRMIINSNQGTRINVF